MEETISQKELKARKILENLVQDNRIFMDTCSIIDASDLFWKHIKPFLTKYEKKIIVPTRCCEELVKKSRDEKDAGLAKTANTRLFLLQTLQTEGFVEFRGEKTDNFADNVFLSVFTKFRLQHNLLLITQDNKLAQDIVNLNNSGSQKSVHIVKVRRINKYNYFKKTKPMNRPKHCVLSQ